MSHVFEMFKNLIFDPKIRFYYLSKLGFYNSMSDKDYLSREFRLNLGRKINWNNPQTFNEKLQWLKIYDRDSVYTTMADKIEAKKYVASIIGEEYIIPTLGVWDRFDDIDFAQLPDQFVLKCNHDSGGLVIVRDKYNFDRKYARRLIESSLKRKYFYIHREWPYKNIRPRIVAEKYVEDEKGSLRDYKFFNFEGKPKFLYVSEGLEDHTTAKISFFDLKGHKLPFKRSDFKTFDKDIKLPDNFNHMLFLNGKLAEKIGNTFVRIDFYCINDKVYFSEITFFPCAGLIPFEPMEWDFKLGELIKLSDIDVDI